MKPVENNIKTYVEIGKRYSFTRGSEQLVVKNVIQCKSIQCTASIFAKCSGFRFVDTTGRFWHDIKNDFVEIQNLCHNISLLPDL